jgi:hypothetical protein
MTLKRHKYSKQYDKNNKVFIKKQGLLSKQFFKFLIGSRLIFLYCLIKKNIGWLPSCNAYSK